MYVPSSTPIPQNSAVAPPPDVQGDMRRARNAQFSRYGRERVYATLVDPASLAYLGLGTAVDAYQAIHNSEPTRQAVLIGVGNSTSDDAAAGSFLSGVEATTLQDLQNLIAQAPVVYSLNGSQAMVPAGGVANPTVVSGSQGAVMAPTMPQAAPIPKAGVYMNPAPPKRPTPSTHPSVSRVQQPKAPGCGMSGMPPWSNAYIVTAASQGGAIAAQGGGIPGWVVVAGLGALGLWGLSAGASKKRRKR